MSTRRRKTLAYDRLRLKWAVLDLGTKLESELNEAIGREDLPTDVRRLLRNVASYIKELKRPERLRRSGAHEVAKCVKKIMDEHPTGISLTKAVQEAEPKLHLTERQIWARLKEAGAQTIDA